MNYYFAYGLSIATEINFSELFVIAPVPKPDLSIRIGEIPAQVKDKAKEHNNNLINSTDYFLHINNIASYYATKGKEIIIRPIAGAKEKSIRLYCLSNAIAAILYQRGHIPIHTSAIFTNEGIALFLGDSGAGKSTTVASLEAKGHRIFSDDVCVPIKEGNMLKAFAAYPMMKLWKDTFGKVDIGSYKEENRIRPEIEKFHKSFYEAFDIKAQPISKIFILEKDDSINNPQSKPLQGLQAFKYLQYYAYRPSYIELMGLKKAYFELLSTLANQIPVTLISRPQGTNTIPSVIQLIENQLAEK